MFLAFVGAPLLAAQASPVPQTTIGQWRLYTDADRKICQAGRVEPGNDEVMLIEYNAKTRGTVVSFTNKFATSLNKLDSRTLRLIFLKGDNVDEGWGDVTFKAWVQDDGTRLLSSQPLDPPLLHDLAKANTIGFFYGDKLVVAFLLPETTKMVPALKKCAMDVAGINPKDPFAAD